MTSVTAVVIIALALLTAGFVHTVEHHYQEIPSKCEDQELQYSPYNTAWVMSIFLLIITMGFYFANPKAQDKRNYIKAGSTAQFEK